MMARTVNITVQAALTFKIMNTLKKTLATIGVAAALGGTAAAIPTLPKQLDWQMSYETVAFNTPSGQLSDGEYAVSESGHSYYIKVAGTPMFEVPTTGGYFIDSDYKVPYDLKQMTFRVITGKAWYHVFRDPDDNSKTLEKVTQKEYTDLGKKNAGKPTKTKLESILEHNIPKARAAIAFDTKGNSTEQTAVSSITLSYTMGSVTNGALVVGSSVRNTSNATFTHLSSVTYNGVGMTSGKVQDAPTYAGQRYISAELWYLAGPASGAHNIVATYGASIQRGLIGGISFSGVDPTTPKDASAGSAYTDTSSSPSGDPWTTSITTVADNAWIVNVLYNSSDFDTHPNNGETVGWEITMNGGGDFGADSAYKGPITPAGATTTGWVSGSGGDETAIAAISLKPFVTAATDGKPLILFND